MSDAKRDQDHVERILRAAIGRAEPPRLQQALSDAVFAGGARVRPLLCLAVARAASGMPPNDEAAAHAAAIELIHCASLVHDDLPCFDNADTRRGLPTIHRRYGEAAAVLVGDALIVAAFETLAVAGARPASFASLAKAAGGSGGLASGQALELEPGANVSRYHRAKTAALFEAATQLGAASVSVDDQIFAALGRRLGQFYQLADDAADVFGNAVVLGKPVLQDARHRRPSAFGSVASPTAGMAILRRAADEVVAAVPACTGHDDLCAFVAGVTQKLIGRSIASKGDSKDASATPARTTT